MKIAQEIPYLFMQQTTTITTTMKANSPTLASIFADETFLGIYSPPLAFD